MEDLEITLADQMRGAGGRGVDFNAVWESAGTRGFITVDETFALGATVTTVEEAIQRLVGFLGLESAERGDRGQSGAIEFTALRGIFRGGKEIFARAKFALAEGQVTMQLSVRSQDPDVAELILSSIG